MTRRPLFCLLLLAATAITLLIGVPAYSYLPDFTTPGPAQDHWDFSAFPVQWNLNPSKGTNVTGTRTVEAVMQAAFSTWMGAPNATIAVTEGTPSTVSTETGSPPGTNLICFVCADADFTKDATTLAVTITTTANAPGQATGHGGVSNAVGQLLKADIIFNPSTAYSTDLGACAPAVSTCQDLQTVATHEIGHFLGLDHSAVVRAVMFPAASSIVKLSYDDVAGLSVLYPKAVPDVATGSITGTVAFVNGNPVFGAHVYAESTTGNQPFAAFASIRKSPIGTVTRPDGSYNIQGLPADSYIVTAEPLDGPVSNSDISGYPSAFGQTAVQTSFTTRWH